LYVVLVMAHTRWSSFPDAIDRTSMEFGGATSPGQREPPEGDSADRLVPHGLVHGQSRRTRCFH
jgi:hypothetical protein